jgi:hypothetical protein
MVRFSTGTIIIAEIAAFHNSRQTAMFPSHHQKNGSFPVMVNGGDAIAARVNSMRLDELRPKTRT